MMVRDMVRMRRRKKKYIQNVDLAVKSNLVWLERGLGRDQKDIDRVIVHAVKNNLI